MADKANEIILELKAENKLLAAKIEDSENRLHKFEKSAKDSGMNIKEFFKNAAEVIGVYMGVEAVKHLIELAAEIDSVETSFNDLAGAASGGAEGLLEAMKKASQGTVDDLDMMKAANSALLTLGDQVADKLPKLMEIAVASSKATGQSTEESFNKMVMAVQSGSARMLRQVGLSAAQVISQ
jgi:hypothetical protein